MSRYIKVEKAMELCDAFYFTNETCSVEWLFKNAPSIDIVRCEECKYEKRCTTNVHFLADNGLDVIPVHFCSYGEREGE